MRLTNNVTESILIDKSNGNTYWKDAIGKDMKKSNISYKPREYCTPEEVRKGEVDDMHGYHEIICHVIFDVKMDFTRKDIFVGNGSNTEAPVALTYSSVVSRDIIQLELFIAALNDLGVMAPCKEKIWFKAGVE